jgi:purine-binding chemotaxis protein CheW
VTTPEVNAAPAWCLVRIGAQPFAVALPAVAEVVEAEELVRLPLCPPRILGLCTYRRDLIPVVGLLETSATTTGRGEGRPLVLLLRSEHGTWGIEIDRGGTVVAEGRLDERNASPLDSGGTVFIGSITRGESVSAVIDHEATWRNIRKQVEDWYKRAPGRDHRQAAVGSNEASV